MNQVVHILRKDAEQLWPQISLPTGALVFATLLQATRWTFDVPLLFSLSTVADVLLLLFTMSWIVVIVSLIQAERLVGLNQFWTTRPYQWQELLAAKFAFLLLFLYLPLLLSQVILLLCSGLPILQSIPSLLLNLVVFTAVIILPACCAAAVTRSIQQAAGVMLSLLSVVALLGFLAFALRKLPPPYLFPVEIAFSTAVLASSLTHQYRTRNTTQSIRLLLLLPFGLLTLQLAVPGTTLASSAYPVVAEGAPLAVHFDPDPLRRTHLPISDSPGTRLFLRVPLLDDDIAPDTSFQVDGHRLILAAVDGSYRWVSPWTALAGSIQHTLVSPEVTASSEFPIPLSVYRRLGNGPVRIRVEFALAQLHDQPPISVQLSTDGASIPGLGTCALNASYSAITCRSAVYAPSRFSIQTFRKADSCVAPGSSREPATATIGDTGGLILPHVSSITETDLRLSAPTHPGYLCPGLPITFIEHGFQRRLRIATPEATVQLKDYVASMQLQ